MAAVEMQSDRAERVRECRVVGFRLDAESHARLKAIARRNHRTVSDEVRSRFPELDRLEGEAGAETEQQTE